jgi:GNAT superfamily N-acetyltransferase
MDKNADQPSLLHVEPVLAVRNITETVTYWHDVLGFPDKWTWGDPPNHGGVSWHGAAFIQFSLNPQLAALSKGHSVWIRVRHLELLYDLHRKNAVVVAPLENRPWGFAEYTVQEINGYYINFSAPIADKKKSTETLPDTIRILPRKPTVAEHQRLISAVGWSPSANDSTVRSLLASAVFGAVAENTETREIAGCALLLGDRVGFYYIKDVMVHPDWQGKRIGTALMQELMRWLAANAPDRATVGLFTGEHLARFYRQFGFTQACGMYREIQREAKDRFGSE